MAHMRVNFLNILRKEIGTVCIQEIEMYLCNNTERCICMTCEIFVISATKFKFRKKCDKKVKFDSYTYSNLRIVTKAYTILRTTTRLNSLDEKVF
jgi:hypothetical protein